MNFTMQDIEQWIQRFDRSTLADNKGALTSSLIILPSLFLKKSLKICSIDREAAGWLICKKGFAGDFISYMVEYIYVSDIGEIGEVYPSKKMQLEEGYGAIEFHTHPSPLGEVWYKNFSQDDLKTFLNRLSNEQEGISYKHVLFTPTHILTFGRERPNLMIGKGNKASNREVMKRVNHWRDICGTKPKVST